MFRPAHVLAVALALVACGSSTNATAKDGTQLAPPLQEGLEGAIFAAGCFWCIEKDFEKLPGVVNAVSGYTGGPEKHPTYEDVGYHRTGHYEAVLVIYDPDKVDYARLLEFFWHNVDPGQSNGQFCDKGNQYRSAVFTSDPQERKLALASKKAVGKQLGIQVATKVLPEAPFWVAESYHQDFYKKNPGHYNRYRMGCGRDARLKQIWGSKAGH